jgi:hypothetical protein
MKDFEKLGLFYLGKLINKETGELEDVPLLYKSQDLTTHAIILGMTGSGKTGLGIDLLEEAGIDHLPSLIIDPKGDLGNLLLNFPDLSAEEFAPWIDDAEARAKGMDTKTYAAATAKKWKEKLAEWGQGEDKIHKLRDAVEMTIYTPASRSGVPISILSSFAAPPADQKGDVGAIRDKILSTTSSLLSLIGIEADPVKSREHILISTLISQAWEKGINVDLPMLIQQIQKPPFDKIGVLDLDSFFPTKDRIALSISLNNLLASPGFQAWMEGVPLDIKQMLYTKEGKPKLSIFSIAHLSDQERMFFVTLFLNELLTWIRRQPGTSSLRAILYMDEIFGYFPPVANPPSKLPLITLLKQARAFGLGIVLATQNPVDLDYKGLSNCGTWFIGKLQTERDKSKVFEGIKSTASTEISTDEFNQMISLTGNQNFILLNVHDKEPVLFKTRWALSYLRGPLTLNQIEKLTKESPERGEKISQEMPSTTEKKTTTTVQPIVPPGITEFFANRAIPRQNVKYQPLLGGMAKLHFVDTKNQVDAWQNVFLLAPSDDDGTSAVWEKGENRPEVKNVLEKTPWPGSSFKELPSGLTQEKNFKNFEKSFAPYLLEHQFLTIYRSPELKLNSYVDETEGDFRTRISQGMREKRDEMTQALREKYKTKINALNAKMQQAQEKVEKQKEQSSLQKTETYISVGATLLGTLFGKKITKGTISQAGTSFKRMGRIQKGSQDVQRAEDSYQNYQQQLQELEEELNAEIAKNLTTMDNASLKLDKILVRLKKSDIAIEKVALIWWPITNS